MLDTKKKFYVYRYFNTPHIKIHKGSCSYCNNGEGIHLEKSGLNSEWFGPFENYEDARKKAESVAKSKGIDMSNVTDCGYCNPQI